MVTKEIIKKIPKVELHDHLDGGLRPQTIIELANEYRIDLPADNPADLAAWFHRGAEQKSLPLYLETFAVTVGVMQTKEALERTAYESIVDPAAENVVYTEIRFAPRLHLAGNLNLEEVVSSVLRGLQRGKK